MMSRVSAAAGIRAGCTEDDYSFDLLQELKILQPKVNPNPFIVSLSSFLALGSAQSVNNRAWLDVENVSIVVEIF